MEISLIFIWSNLTKIKFIYIEPPVLFLGIYPKNEQKNGEAYMSVKGGVYNNVKL